MMMMMMMRMMMMMMMMIMFNIISHKAEILVSLVFAVRAGIKADVKGLAAISFPGYLTR